jgi:methylenetetrahydrofolate reductase (NADPH)
MECPKGMRNGPCGSPTSSGNCYVDESRKCIWQAIYKRSFKTGREEKLLEILPPLDWNKVGTETWGDVVKQVRITGTGKFLGSLISNDKQKKTQIWESVFRTVRQPGWWNGDSDYHPPGHIDPVSELEKKLRSGQFVIATEVTPSISSDPTKLTKDIELVKPYVTAINFTDSASATSKMSSMACSIVAKNLGAEPVLQIAARDTTRSGLQSDIVGINSTGIFNVLCVTGDNPVIGPSPVSSMNLLDIDSVQMLWILRRMRDEGIYLDGRKMKYPPKLFLGAATTPFADDPECQALKDQKKINAGAQFFQTNIVFEPDRLDPWLEQLDKRNLLDKVYILIGIAPLKNYKTAEYLNKKVPGVTLPESVLKRMEKAGEGASEEGVKIALEIIDKVKTKKGVNGIHIMTMGWESIVQRIVKDAGLTPPTPPAGAGQALKGG